MVHCCVCANCTNSNLSGHRVHVFPSKRSPVFNSWLKFVQVTRRNFNTNSINTKHSVVCSAHFLDSDYLEGDVLEYRMGFRTKQRIRLKPNAIPSVHTTSTKNTGTASKRKAGNGDSESCPGIMAAVVTHQAVTELLPAVCRKLEASKELRTCTALSSSRMQAGVCLREDTEPAPAELREQDRISPEEEQLSGLEPVPMAEPERDCAAPALSSLQPECVTAHREGRDAHHTHTSLIKTETELDSTLTGDLIKTESLDSSELGNVVHLQPDQIKTETDDGSYMKAEQCSDTQDFTCDDVKSEQMKCESGGSLESDVMNTVMNEECNKEEMNDLQTACGGITQHCEKPGAGGQSSFIQEGKHSATSKKMCEENELKHSQPENSFMKPCLLKQSKTTQANGKPYKRIQSGKNSMRATCVKDRRIDTGEKPYRCTCCGKGFSHTSSLSRHHRIHSAEKTYKCTLCRKRFNCASSLNEHQKIHTEQKYYKCTECGKCFKHSSSLCRHQRIHKGENAHENTLGFDLNPQRINSGLKWVFEKLSDLNPHQRTQTCKGPYSCIYCGKNFKYSYSLSRHERNHSGEKPFECTLCGRCFNCTSDLNVHQRIHTGEKPKKCMQCGRCFNHTSSLNKHLRIHSGEKPYKCTRCEKCFISKSSLNDHVRIHTGEKPYRCTYCGKCFNQSTNLTQHLRYHTGEKPYRCSHCTMCFNQATTLKKHLRTHTGERPYTCVQCGKCFTCKSNLNNHMRIHTGEKPFKCTHCGKCFNQASHLTQHLKIHSGANPYKCTECKKCFSQASALKKHLKVHTDKWL